MSYNKLDKINSLELLDQNNGNVLRTAREVGVNRKTLARWEEQLESDRALERMFEAAKANVKRQEAIIALEAQAELSRRLDESPDRIKDADLVRMRDSGLANSKLLEDAGGDKRVDNSQARLAMDRPFSREGLYHREDDR